MTILYLAEPPARGPDIEAVLNRAFGPGRFAKTSERVRERGARHRPELSRIAIERDDQSIGQSILGVCRIFDVEANGAPALFLGPLAVDPAAQHHGLGAQLVRECLVACRAAGGAAVICVGAAAFFEPLGFSLTPPGRITLPGPVIRARFLWIALRRGGFDGLTGPISAPRAASRA